MLGLESKKLLMLSLSVNIIMLLMLYFETYLFDQELFDQDFFDTNTQNLSSSSLFYPSDTPDAFFKELKAEGNTNPSPDFKRSRKVTLVKSNPQFFACNAPKTGCTAWRYFWLYVNKGKRWNSSEIEQNPGLIHENRGWKMPRDLDLSSEIIVVARNPYVRFLSSYRDWLFRVGKNETSVPFSVFVDEYLKVFQGHGNKHFFKKEEGGKVLWNHIESVSKFCELGTENATVVRVEEQALWINQFLVKYNLTEKMDNYIKHGNVVYSSGLQEGSLVKDFTSQISGSAAWPAELMKSNHHRDSAGKITKYYTPDIARKVTEIVFDDLVNFGYPLWNGVAENFRYV